MAEIDKRSTEALITFQVDRDVCIGHVKLVNRRMQLSLLKPKSHLTLKMNIDTQQDSFLDMKAMAFDFLMHRAMSELSKMYFTSRALTIAKPALVGSLLPVLSKNPVLRWNDDRIREEVKNLPPERRDEEFRQLLSTKAELMENAKTTIRTMFEESDFQLEERSIAYLVYEILSELGAKF